MARDVIEKVVNNLLALRASEVLEPDKPVDIVVQEADDLYVNSQKDKVSLAMRGITEKKIKSLLTYSEALYVAESDWFVERGKKEEANKKWLAISGTAHDLRDIILHDFRYAYRNDENIISKLKEVSKGATHSDMIQDLGKLIAVSEKYPENLIKMNFDMTLLDKAKEMSKTLGLIYAEAKAEDRSSEAKDIRDRAYTCLKMVVDEIRAAGQNLFWRTPERLKYYRSEYKHKMNTKRIKKNNDDSLAA